jgi:cytochrome c peroxidase
MSTCAEIPRKSPVPSFAPRCFTLPSVLVLVLVLCGCDGTSPAAPEIGAVDGGSGVPTRATSDSGAAPVNLPYAWNLPPGFPPPQVPEDNPMTLAKVELGRHLFYDQRLSENGTYSCATCHEQARAFTDAKARAIGSTGQAHPRGSMSLANVAYAATLTWGHPFLASLERQAQLPMFGDAPIELGLRSQAEVEALIRGLPEYAPLFDDAFPEDEPKVTLLNVERAIASFERSLISGQAPFDRWLMAGDEGAISDSAKRGYALFNTETFECYHCHGGFAFTDHVVFADEAFPQVLFHNTGLYNIDGRGAFPAPNTGVENVSENPADMGRFKAPTLRNIAVTAPYMHDGSIATLSEVLDHYAAGGRTISDGPEAGIGSANPFKSNFVRGFRMAGDERADLIAFLESLTDSAFLANPRQADPWR